MNNNFLEQDKFANKKSFKKKDFTEIYEHYSKKIYDFVYKRVSSKEVAEDLSSEIFEKVYKSIEDFKWQGITISAWIFRIARNSIIDYYRKYSKRTTDMSIDDYSNILVSSIKKAEEMMIDDEDNVRLYNAIREFKEQDQYLIYYKFFENFSNSEIAKIMNMSETNVGTKLHRIKTKLAKEIKKLEKIS